MRLCRKHAFLLLLVSMALAGCKSENGKGSERQAIPQILQAVGQLSAHLRVTSASPTYPGFVFENALDGDPANNYVAGLENQSDNYVVLSISPPSSAKTLRIVWENNVNFSRSIRISEVDNSGKIKREIARPSGLIGPKSVIFLDVNEPLVVVRLDFSDFSGQSRPLLRLIEVK